MAAYGGSSKNLKDLVERDMTRPLSSIAGSGRRMCRCVPELETGFWSWNVLEFTPEWIAEREKEIAGYCRERDHSPHQATAGLVLKP